MGGNICFLFLEVSAGSHLYKVRHVIASATLFLLVSTRVDGTTLQSSDALASLLIRDADPESSRGEGFLLLLTALPH